MGKVQYFSMLFSVFLSSIAGVAGELASDTCCDCMRGEGGSADCARWCRGQNANCDDYCFSETYPQVGAWNECRNNMEKYCTFPAGSVCPVDKCCNCIRQVRYPLFVTV